MTGWAVWRRPSATVAWRRSSSGCDGCPWSSSTRWATSFDPEAAALFFALVSSRYERASLIVSSNKTFSAWAEIFGDAVAVAAMVDRLVHHAEVLVLQGESYRLKDRGKQVVPVKLR